MTTITATPDTDTGSVTLQITQTSPVTEITRSNANGISSVRVATSQLPTPATGTTIITDYEAAHGVNNYTAYVTDTATRTNLATNPSVEVDTAGYTAARVTLEASADWSAVGTKSLKTISTGVSVDSYATVGGDGGAFRLGMQAGKTYTVSATVNTPVALTGESSGARRIYFFYKTAAGAYVSVLSPQGPVTGSARVSVTVTIPDGAAEAFIRLYNASPTLGDVVYWDGILVEESATLKPYFDGSTPDATDVDYAWTGTDNASTSTETITTRQATATATLTIDKPWLMVPIAPNYSEQVATVLNYSAGYETHSTIHHIIGRADVLVVMGKLGTRSGRLEFYAESLSDVQRLARVFDRGEAVLLKQTVPGMDLYFAATSLDIQPLSVEGPDVTRYQFTVNYQEVSRPFGDLAGALGWTFDALAADYASFDAVTAAFASFDDLTLMDTK